jgi:hypothetical protein
MAWELRRPLFMMQVQAVLGQVYYRDHTIINIARPSQSGFQFAAYIAMAVISWKMPDRFRCVMHCLKLPDSYRSLEDARTAALVEAKAWVDRHRLT